MSKQSIIKLKYEFADGTVSEIEVSEELGAYITASCREEENYERKTRYHCKVSLDSLEYEGEWLADETHNPERAVLREEEERQVQIFLASLTDKQRSRVQRLMDGKSIREISEEEGVAYLTVYDSIELVKKKAKQFFNC